MIFTYLIGAGASANTIPVIKDFDKELYLFADYIDKYIFEKHYYEESYVNKDYPYEIRKKFVDDIRWLAKEYGCHSSVDTFAKKLFLSSRKGDLILLKEIISEFILYKHIKKGIDIRYDAFFAALLRISNSGFLELPENIRIISWNYDKQIEASIAQFRIKDTINDNIEDFLQVCPRSNQKKFDENKFCLFKINGSIGGTITKDGKYLPIGMDYSLVGDNIHKIEEDNILFNIFLRYNLIKDIKKNIDKTINNKIDEYPTIIYSWEDTEVFNSVREKALMTTKYTSVLTIIGYSFPTFNREIDKKIIVNMTALKKVIIQSPKESIEGVKQRFLSLIGPYSTVEVELNTNVEEFVIPFEY